MYQDIATALVLVVGVVFCKDCGNEFDILINHYFEMDCKPVFSDSGVVDQFQCPDFESFDKEKCHLQGKMYNPHDTIEKEFLPKCMAECFCGPSFGAAFPAKFNCHYDHCFEQGGFYNKPCVFQRTFSNCCAEKIICDEEEISELHRCHYDGQTYREGEIINSVQKCYTCICSRGYDNETDVSTNPSCQRNKEICNTQINAFKQYQMGCVPIYYGQHPQNCPTKYQCPKDSDEVVKGDVNNSGGTCKFGKLIFQRGDKLIDNCIECTCSVPPMLTCRQYSECAHNDNNNGFYR